MISNDPKTPKRFLRVSAQVRPLIEVSPTPYVNVTKKYGQALTRTLAVWSPVAPDFKVAKVESFTNGVMAEIIKSWRDKGGNHYNIKITFGPKMRIGRFHGVIRLFTSLKKAPTYDLRISGMVQGPVSVIPQRGSLFSDPAIMGGMAAAGFSLYATEKPVEIKKTTTTLENLQLKVITVSKGRKYYLVAIWPGGAPPRNPYNGKIVVTTSSATQPAIEIPLSIYARVVKKPRGTGPKPMGPPPGKK